MLSRGLISVLLQIDRGIGNACDIMIMHQRPQYSVPARISNTVYLGTVSDNFLGPETRFRHAPAHVNC